MYSYDAPWDQTGPTPRVTSWNQRNICGENTRVSDPEPSWPSRLSHPNLSDHFIFGKVIEGERNFFFSQSVFSRLVLQKCKNKGLFWKSLDDPTGFDINPGPTDFVCLLLGPIKLDQPDTSPTGHPNFISTISFTNSFVYD